MGIVTCKKCRKIFDYDKYMGICPKCCHYYSTTSYDEDLKYESNILSSSDSSRCSYHGEHDIYGNRSGHYERMHTSNTTGADWQIQKEKEEIARKLREKYDVNGQRQNVTQVRRVSYQTSSNSNSNNQQGRQTQSSVDVKISPSVVIIWVVIFISCIFPCLFSCVAS